MAKNGKKTDQKKVGNNHLIDPIKLVDQYLHGGNDDKVKHDSNENYSVHNLAHETSSIVVQEYWLNKIYNKKIRDAHYNGDIRIHNLGYLSTYCSGWDLKDLLVRGYGGVFGKVSCAPAKHLMSALDQLVSFLFTLRYEADGAQAIANFDTYLAPFIRYDKLSYFQVKQMLQQFVFKMNVPLDKGFQAPFSNVSLDIVPPKSIAEENVIIGGKMMKEKYGDFQKEMLIFNKAFAKVMMEGDSKGRVFVWPIPTYSITKDFPWDEPKLKPVWEMTAKFGIPYFSNFVNSDMSPDDVRSMCCRLRIDNRVLRKRGGGLFGANPLTGSIGIVTINLPRIGYLSKTKKEFIRRLGALLDTVKESLQIKRKTLERLTDDGLYPYNRVYLENVKKRFGEYWKNHFNTIGIMGMNEACLNLLKADIASEEGKAFTLEVMDYIRDRMLEFQKETDEIFNLEATPGETTAYSFAKKDKQLYPNIICANEDEYRKSGAAPYYTNSTQLPVCHTTDLFDSMNHQDEIQCKYTGGTVFHVFLGEKLPSVESTKKLVKKISDSYKMPYYSITPTFSICPKHGYIAGEKWYCPLCDAEIRYKEGKKLPKGKKRTMCEVYSRVVGYISPVALWNRGKKSEWSDRRTFITREI